VVPSRFCFELISCCIRNSLVAVDKRNKNDAADAAAICEAVRRPTMRFVRIKTAEQQGQLIQHHTRDLMMRQRTQVINALRAHLAEFGIVAAQGDKGVKELLAVVADQQDARLPVDARASLMVLAAQLERQATLTPNWLGLDRRC
jgi:transposase